MSHSNTILSQILKLVPRHEFNKLEKQHDGSRRSDALSRQRRTDSGDFSATCH